MKRLYLLVALVLLVPYAKAQTWDWAWEKDGGGTAHEEIGGQSVSDINGNTYVVGSFQSATATFGSSTVTLNGSRNMFVVKYNNLGNVMWAKNPAAGNDNMALAVAIDPMGTGIFVSGTYTGPSVTFGSFTLSSATNGGMYVVKYDNSGTVVWAHNALETGSSSAMSVTADAWGNCYVAGEFHGPTIDFGTGPLANMGLDTFDMFLVKYNSTGNTVWARNGGGAGIDGAKSVSIGSSGSGHVYVTGYFSSSTATFGSTSLTNGNANLNTFIVKYDTSGNALWARRSVGNTGNNGNWVAAAIDPLEDVYVSGSFTGTNVVFDTATLVNANSGTRDAFLVQYDSSGTLKHAMRLGGAGNEIAGVTVDQNFIGNVFLTGYYSSDSLTVDTVTLHNIMTNGTTDVFVAGFNNLWNSFVVKSFGGKLDDRALSCRSHGIGDMYIAGDFTGQYVAFGADSIENNAIDSTGDIFVAKLSVVNVGIPETQHSTNLLVYPNPVKDILNIQLPDNAEKADVTLFNITGQEMKVQEGIAGQTKTLHLSGLAPGLYILQLKMDAEVKYFKIMLQP